MTLTAAADDNPVSIVPDNDGGAVITQAQTVHLSEKDIDKLLATVGRRVSPCKARMLRYKVQPRERA